MKYISRLFMISAPVLLLALFLILSAKTAPQSQAQLLCTKEYLPVCGVDGITYGNDCEATGIPIAYPGVCEGRNFNEDLRPFTIQIKWGYFEKTATGSTINMDGYIDMQSKGKVFLKKNILFESADNMLARDANNLSRLEWSSTVTNDYDALKVRIYPQSLDQEIKIRAGEVTKVYTVKDLRSINSTFALDNLGHKAQIQFQGMESFQKPALVSLVWGKLPELDTGRDTKKHDWQGKITFTNGTGKLVRTLFFEGNDTITPPVASDCTFNFSGSGSIVSGCSNSNEISFTSATTNRYEGVVFYVPDDTALITVKLNEALNKTFTVDDLRNIDLLEKTDSTNGYHLQNLYNHPYVLLSNLFDRQTRILSKLFDIEEKLYQLNDIFGTEIGRAIKAIRSMRLYGLFKEQYMDIEEDLSDFQSVLSLSTLTSDHLGALVNDIDRFFNIYFSEGVKRKFEKNLLAFKDTDDSAWYYDFVKKLKDLRIISGYKDKSGMPLGTFIPGNNVTVAEIFKVVLNAAAKGEDSGLFDQATVSNQDVGGAKNHWARQFYQVVLYKNYRILTDDKFSLDTAATRGQVIGFIMDAFGIDTSDAGSSCFSDVQVGYKYAKDICEAKLLGIVSGNPDGTFKPLTPINRAEISKIMVKILELFGTL